MSGFVLPFQVPQAQPSAEGWQLYDYRPDGVIVSAKAAGGIAVGVGPVVDPDTLWLIDRAVCYCTSTAPTTLALYDSQQAPRFLRDGSESGNFDVTEYASSLQLGQSSQLVAVWTGADAGAIGTLTYQARILRRVG